MGNHTEIERYDQAFIETFNVTAEQMPGLKYQDVTKWDSVGHMEMIASLEEAFDIMMETEDIIDFSSYEKGIEILTDKYDISF